MLQANLQMERAFIRPRGDLLKLLEVTVQLQQAIYQTPWNPWIHQSMTLKVKSFMIVMTSQNIMDPVAMIVMPQLPPSGIDIPAPSQQAIYEGVIRKAAETKTKHLIDTLRHKEWSLH